MLDILRPVLVAAVTALVISALRGLLRRSKAVSSSGNGGTIRPERWSAWVTIIGGVAIAALALVALLFVGNLAGLALAVPLALLGIAIAGFMAPSVTSVHMVHWNETGIEGPSTTFGLTLGTKRTAISWEQIERTGRTATGYWFVEAADKRRIYWSYLYAGYRLLAEALQRHRPSLELPSDMI